MFTTSPMGVLSQGLMVMPFPTTYDKLSVVDQGVIVENKRLRHVLQVAQEVQTKWDSWRSQSVSAGDGAFRKRGQAPSTNKRQRSIEQDDIQTAIIDDFLVLTQK